MLPTGAFKRKRTWAVYWNHLTKCLRLWEENRFPATTTFYLGVSIIFLDFVKCKVSIYLAWILYSSTQASMILRNTMRRKPAGQYKLLSIFILNYRMSLEISYLIYPCLNLVSCGVFGQEKSNWTGFFSNVGFMGFAWIWDMIHLTRFYWVIWIWFYYM